MSRFLTRRFGPLPECALARMQEACTEQLDTWLDRVLDAPTMAAVFDDR